MSFKVGDLVRYCGNGWIVRGLGLDELGMPVVHLHGRWKPVPIELIEPDRGHVAFTAVLVPADVTLARLIPALQQAGLGWAGTDEHGRPRFDHPDRPARPAEEASA